MNTKKVIHKPVRVSDSDREFLNTVYKPRNNRLPSYEKNINISRSSVTIIKNNIGKDAEKWCIKLRDSRYKFIATYKERLDFLLSYQKKLNDILGSSKKEETKIKALTALQSIELDIFNIFKHLPEVRIEDNNAKSNSANRYTIGGISSC
jgi:hypothetical protein